MIVIPPALKGASAMRTARRGSNPPTIDILAMPALPEHICQPPYAITMTATIKRNFAMTLRPVDVARSSEAAANAGARKQSTYADLEHFNQVEHLDIRDHAKRGDSIFATCFVRYPIRNGEALSQMWFATNDADTAAYAPVVYDIAVPHRVRATQAPMQRVN